MEAQGQQQQQQRKKKIQTLFSRLHDRAEVVLFIYL